MPDDLRTARLTLRKVVADDAVHFARLLGGDSEGVQMMATMPDPCTEPDARRWIENRLSLGFRIFAIIRTEDGEFLGTIGVGGPPDRMELGYWIGRPFQGRGYVTEAVQAMIDYARQLGAVKMYAGTWPHNTASARVLLKVGFRDIGPTIIDLPSRGGLRETDQYELDLG